MPNLIDLTNQKFGRLTVLELDVERNKTTKRSHWICKCECGKIVSVDSFHLRNGKIRSCGCLKRELSQKRLSKSNRIEFDNNYGCLRVYFNNCDEYFLCDLEDKDIVEKYCWYKDSNGYVATVIKDENKVKHGLLFHREVMKRKFGDISYLLVDHKNHNTLDNRKNINLRLCTYGENMKNSKPTSNTGAKYISYILAEDRFIVSMPNEPQKSFREFSQAFDYSQEYYKTHFDEFRYDPSIDIRNLNNMDIIKPFIIVDKDKFNRKE